MHLNRSFRCSAFVLLLIEFLLIFAPLLILGAAINWPAGLDEPASVNLPLILAQAGAVKLGYFLYLIYSVLIIPVAFVISRIVGGTQVVGGTQGHNTLLQIANGFAIGSAVLRVLGIIRWLIPMPVLAQVYTDPATTPATREAVAVMYDMLNAYAGSVGEVLGVGFFAALWVAATAIVILRDGTLPRWVGVYGLITAVALMAGLLEIVNIDAGAMLTFNVTMLHFWWLAIALIVLVRPQWVRVG
jgi:hypothetical protein